MKKPSLGQSVSTLFVADCSYLCMSELKKWQKSSQLSKDEITEFFTKTERKFSFLFFKLHFRC